MHEEEKISAGLQESIKLAMQMSEDYAKLSDEEKGIAQTLASQFDYEDILDIFGERISKTEVKDYVQNLTDTLNGNTEIQNAWNELFNPDPEKAIKDRPAAEYETILNDHLKTIAKAMGIEEGKIDNNLLWELSVSLGIRSEDDASPADLRRKLNAVLIKEFGGLSPIIATDAIMDGMSEAQIKILIDIIPTLSKEDYFSADGKDFDLDKLKSDVDAYNTIVSVTQDMTDKSDGLSSSMASLVNSMENYALIADVVNGKTYMTDEQMAKLINDIPELADKLKYTSLGWSLESSAMDSVTEAVSGLSTAYSNAQTLMTTELYANVKSRLAAKNIDLASIRDTKAAIDAIVASNPNVKFGFDIDGNLKMDSLSAEDKLILQAAQLNEYIDNAQELLKKSTALGSDNVAKQENKAKEDYEKKLRELNEKQQDADFKYKIDSITESLNNQEEALNRLSTAYDKLYENDVTADRIASITARYNDDDYVDISNDSVLTFSDKDRWIKIATYDGVNFYVLHKM